jgi:hypothetical protein
MHISIFSLVQKLNVLGLHKWVGKMEIKVKTITGMKYNVDIDENTTIADIKEVILAKTGISTDQQRYIYQGKLLNEQQILMVLPEITAGMSLNMVLSLRGGARM